MLNAIQAEAGSVSAAGPEFATGVLTPEKLAAILDTAARCAEDPLFEDWIQAVEEYRRENNTVPEADS